MGLTEADLARLGPAAQRQVLKKLTDAGMSKVGKYHNQPDRRGNLRFDSRKEARRYDELMLRLKAGQIRDLRLQVDFTLQEAFTDTDGKRVRAIRYRADFTYWERDAAEESRAADVGWPCDSWRYVVEDVKSEATRTTQYETKKKLLRERFGLTIREV